MYPSAPRAPNASRRLQPNHVEPNSNSRSHTLLEGLARRHSHSHHRPSQPFGFAYNEEESTLVFAEPTPIWKLTTVMIIFFFSFIIMPFFRPSFAFAFLLPFFTLLISSASVNHGVFSVKYKYAGQERTLSLLKAHDSRRQLRFLAGVDLPLGGSGRPDGVGSGFLFLLLQLPLCFRLILCVTVCFCLWFFHVWLQFIYFFIIRSLILMGHNLNLELVKWVIPWLVPFPLTYLWIQFIHLYLSCCPELGVMYLWICCRLYYAKIGIGTPSKDYYLQVDTGSDIMWVNCIQCRECPSRSSLGVCLFSTLQLFHFSSIIINVFFLSVIVFILSLLLFTCMSGPWIIYSYKIFWYHSSLFFF